MDKDVFYSSVSQRHLPPGVRHLCKHFISDELNFHYTNTWEHYESFHPAHGGDPDLEQEHGNDFGSGRVKIPLAFGVELVLDDVVFKSRPDLANTRRKSWIYISLRKLLETPGTSFQVDAYKNWVVWKSGKIWVFGVKFEELKSPILRVALGPEGRDISAAADALSFRPAIAVHAGLSADRPATLRPASIIRSTGPAEREKGAISDGTAWLPAQAPKQTRPKESLPSSRRPSSRAAPTAGIRNFTTLADLQATLPAAPTPQSAHGTNTTREISAPSAIEENHNPVYSNINGMWMADSPNTSALPSSALYEKASPYMQGVPLDPFATPPPPNPKKAARNHRRSVKYKSLPRIAQDSGKGRKLPVPKTKAKPTSASKSTTSHEVSLRDLIFGRSKKTVKGEKSKSTSAALSTSKKPVPQVPVRNKEVSAKPAKPAPTNKSTRTAGTTRMQSAKGASVHQGSRAAMGKSQTPAAQAKAAQAKTATTNPPHSVPTILAATNSDMKIPASKAGQVPDTNVLASFEAAKEAARKHWENRMYRDIPRAGKDTC